MEDLASGIDPSLLNKLRALARRGAILRRAPSGGGDVRVDTAADRPVVDGPLAPVRARLTPEEMLRALDRGWLKDSGAEQFILSKRGATMLRVALARLAATAASEPAPAAAAGARAEARPDTAPARPRSEPRPHVSAPHVNADESPLAWLYQRRDKDGKPLISQAEFDAGERLRADFHTALMTPRVTASWDMTAPGSRQQRGSPAAMMELSDAVIAARQRVDIAMRAVGPNLSGVLIDVCCLLQGLEQAERNGGWPKRAGKVVLQIALDSLARHYGLIRPEHDARRPIARHWGAPGYRPGVGGGAD